MNSSPGQPAPAGDCARVVDVVVRDEDVLDVSRIESVLTKVVDHHIHAEAHAGIDQGEPIAGPQCVDMAVGPA